MGIAIIAKGADFSSNNIGVITPSSNVPLVSIAIVGPATVTGTEADFSVTYEPSNTSQRDVYWSITSGGSYATINEQTGKLTVLPGASSASVTIKAESRYNDNVVATKSVTVTYELVYNLQQLAGFNDFSKKRSIYSAWPTGWAYPLMHAETQYIGGTVTDALSTNANGSCPYFFKIPVPAGSVSVNLPVIKSSSGYGYGFCDDSEVLVSTYLNTTIDTGTYQDIPVPSGATYLIVPLSQTIYNNSEVYNSMTVTFN